MLLENTYCNIQKHACSAKLLWNSMHCEKRYTNQFELNILMPLFVVSRCSRFTVKLSGRCRLTAWTRAVRWVFTPEAERISRLCAQTSLRWEEYKHMLQNQNISAYIMRLKSCNIKISLRLSFDGQALTSSKEKYPIFTFVEGYNEEEMSCTSDSVTHIKSKDRPGRIKKKSCLEEFVLLWRTESISCLVLQYFLQFQSCDQDCHTHWHVKESWTILCVQNMGECRSFCSLSVFYRLLLLFSCFSVVVACKGTIQEDVKSSLSRWLSRLHVFGVMLMTADSEALGQMRGAYVTLWQANMGFGCWKHCDLVCLCVLLFVLLYTWRAFILMSVFQR